LIDSLIDRYDFRVSGGVGKGATIVTGIATAPATHGVGAAMTLRRSLIPVKKPQPSAVNKAFMMGAEAFHRKPLSSSSSPSSSSSSFKGQHTGVVVPSLQRVQESDVISDAGGVTSPRMVDLGGFTPRGHVKLKDKGKTESKQTILSSDSESLTAVGT
jgi:hypothetical protein